MESSIPPLHFSATSLSLFQWKKCLKSLLFHRDSSVIIQWEKWMFDGGGIVDGVAKEPTPKLVAEWIIRSYKNISEETGKNAWKKTGYEWFNN
jgi:hypothetical protein